MEAAELRSKSTDELNKELQSLLRAQFNLRMQKATQQLNNTSQIRKVRRDTLPIQRQKPGKANVGGQATEEQIGIRNRELRSLPIRDRTGVGWR